MAILKSEIRQDILDKVCEKCDEPIPQDDDCILTFYRGCFIILHEDCADFIHTAQKGPRNKREQ